MVSEQARWVLIHTTIDPYLVANAFGITENECWGYLEQLNQSLNEEEKLRHEDEPKRRQDISVFKAEIPEARETTRLLLLERLYKAKRENKGIEKVLAEFKAFNNPDKITPQEVQRAKEKPIRDILNVQKPGNVSCPFHQDRNPSFQIKKNNTFSCYSCGEYGDSIDLYQKLYNCDFRTAVKALQ